MHPTHIALFSLFVFASSFTAQAQSVLRSDQSLVEQPGTSLVSGVAEAIDYNALLYRFMLSKKARSIGENYGVSERVLKQFYKARSYDPVWIGTPERLEALRDYINALERDGMTPQDYDVSDIHAKLTSKNIVNDYRISAAYIRLVRDLDKGRYNPRARINNAKLALKGLEADSLNLWLDSLLPQNELYADLREALRHYHKIDREGELPLIEPIGMLRPNMSDTRIPLIRDILRKTGDLNDIPSVEEALEQEAPTSYEAAAQILTNSENTQTNAKQLPTNSTDTNAYDPQLLAAVKRFQQRHGLKADGVIGPATYRELNTSSEFRILQIKANMERLRWEFEPSNGRYVRVNMASYKLDAYQDGQKVLEMPVIVGRSRRPTPVLADKIVNLKFRPDWTVPPTIFAKDYLPKLLANPSYAENKGFEMYHNGKRISSRSASLKNVLHEVKLRQPPSPSAALGAVRFSLTNNLSIYLHDTPTKSLFKHDKRAYSSGCVRVGKPQALAEYVMNDPQNYPSERVRRLMQSGNTKWVPVPESVQPTVYLSYVTVFKDDKGDLNFLEDFYGYDNEMMLYYL